MDVAIPFRWLGCTGKGSGVMEESTVGLRVAVTGVEVKEEERECFVVSGAAEVGTAWELGEGGA